MWTAFDPERKFLFERSRSSHSTVAAAGRRRRPRSPAHARGALPWLIRGRGINAARGASASRRPRMGPAPAGATATLRHPHAVPWGRRLGAAKRRGFGWAGAGPIRGRLVGDTPTPVLMPRRWHTTGSAPRAWAGERLPGPPATLNGGTDPCASVRIESEPDFDVPPFTLGPPATSPASPAPRGRSTRTAPSRPAHAGCTASSPAPRRCRAGPSRTPGPPRAVHRGPPRW